MKKLITNFYFILFIGFPCFSQEFHIKTNLEENVPYASVIFFRNDTIVGGTYSNELGIVRINSNEDIDKITISHLGFKSKQLKREELRPEILLEENSFELPEIIVSKRNIEPILLGHKVKRKKTFISSRKGLELATLIYKNDIPDGYYLKNFQFRIKRKSEDRTVVLKLNLYANVNNFPGEIINANQDITIAVRPHEKGDILVNLEKYNLLFPSEGAFLSLEWLGLIDEKGNFVETNSYYDSPIAFNREENKSYTFIRNKLKKTNWGNFDLNGQLVVPAFSIEIN
ncbi:hypothetical protein [Mangrovimonas sp. YM274]|uniref:hypothetical protein n=1 Tax=Mangrovimonas sp. YM274 TaxID=3070660 RepID=UPI0027DE83E1|nr:hypothetical protein [Mangrovimonas sp. YM274]WMI68167.1 hypothetical protein RBH95_13560 [Mangrovimonas sp. YM274]